MAMRGRRIDRNLIKRVGRSCLWRQAVLCPCQREDGAQDTLCNACDERGYIYGDPAPIKALLTSDSRKQQFDMQGAWEKGSARATIDCALDVGDQDQLIVLGMPVRDLEVATRSAAGLTDTLRTPRVARIIQLRTKTASYAVGSDFALSVDSEGVARVVWQVGGQRPAADDRYSVQMDINPIWIIASHPMPRTFGARKTQQLPWRCELVRYDRAIASALAA